MTKMIIDTKTVWAAARLAGLGGVDAPRAASLAGMGWLQGDAGGAQLTAQNLALCLVDGTQVATDMGPRAVEKLRRGDMIETADDGLQPVRWVGRMRAPAMGDLAPIRIAAGALGNARALLVPAQQRMVIGGWQVELLFGEDEVMVPAKMLVNGSSIRALPMGEVGYTQILLDQHQVIFAEGAPCESFHPGDVGFEALGIKAQAQIMALFPEMMLHGAAGYGQTARRVLLAHEALALQNTGAKKSRAMV